MNFLDQLFLGNPARAWLLALGLAVGSMVVLTLGLRVMIRRLERFAQKTNTVVDDIIVDALRGTKTPFLVIISLLIGSYVLSLPAGTEKVIRTCLIIAVILQGGVWANRGITFWLHSTVHRRMQEDPAQATTISGLGFLVRLVLWSVILVLLLENLGVNITGLVTGLGIGGIAVALALQNILGDLFASLSIVLDKPFVIGDFIVVDDLLGTVEHIGLKTTRLRSLTGEVIIFSNSDLLKSRIRNYKHMYERRIQFSIGVAYETPAEKLSGIPAMIKEIISRQKNTRFDRAHFKEYAESSLTYEVVYFVTSPDYNLYMDLQQTINLEILRAFDAMGIQFASPTRMIRIRTEGDGRPATRGVITGRDRSPATRRTAARK